MIAKVKGNKIEIKDPVTLVQGTVGQTLGAELPADWEGLSVTAVFSAGAVQRDVPVLGDEITIPWEVLADPHAPLTLCFHAAAANGQRVITTANCDPIRIAPSTAPSGEEPEAPSPSRADQIQALAQQAMAAAQSISTQAAQGAFNGRDGVDGTNGTDGVSPAISVSEIQGGHRIQITDAAGSRSFDVLDGVPGEVTQSDLNTLEESLEASFEAALAAKSDTNGSYDDMTVGNAKQLVAAVGVEDQVPYSFRTSGGSADIGDRKEETIVGGTIVWNQLVGPTDTSVTVVSGHKYVAYVNGSWSVDISNGAARTVDGTNSDMIFDLTQMFGPAIADHVYSLEQSSTGAGAAWFRKLFPKSYYSCSAGQLMSVNTSMHRMTGFNAFDGEVERGGFDERTGGRTDSGSNSNCRNKNPIHVVPSLDYRFLYNKDFVGNSKSIGVYEYDAVGHFIRATFKYVKEFSFTVSANTHYINFRVYDGGLNALSQFGNTCINIRWDGERDGEYAPYELHSYPLDSDLTLRGIPKLDASNHLYYDGDAYQCDGTVTRHFAQRNYQAGDERLEDAITDGTHTVYKLSEPVIETAAPYQNPQIVNDFGTEEYVDYAESQNARDVAIPVGHNTIYLADLRAKLEMMPSSPEENGDYLVRQSSGKNSYVKYTDGGRITALEEKLPSPPAANGSYCLTVTVNGTTGEYAWTSF